jgi:hypothetical protein
MLRGRHILQFGIRICAFINFVPQLAGLSGDRGQGFASGATAATAGKTYSFVNKTDSISTHCVGSLLAHNSLAHNSLAHNSLVHNSLAHNSLVPDDATVKIAVIRMFFMDFIFLPLAERYEEILAVPPSLVKISSSNFIFLWKGIQ